MSIDGERNTLEIDDIINTFKESFPQKIPDQQNKQEIIFFFAEALSLLTDTASRTESQLDLLTSKAYEYINDHNFNLAEEQHHLFNLKLDDLSHEIDIALEKIREYLSHEVEQFPSVQKMYAKRLTSLEKKWKKQKQNIEKILQELKKSIENSYEEWVNNSKKQVENNISNLDSFYQSTLRKLSNLSDLIEKKQISEWQIILRNTENRVKEELDRQKQELNQVSDNLIPHLGDLPAIWKDTLYKIEKEIQVLIADQNEKLQIAIIQNHISDLETFYANFRENVSAIPQLIAASKLAEVEKKLNDLKTLAQTKFKFHKSRLSEEIQHVSPKVEEIIGKWKDKLEIIEKSINILISNTENAFVTTRTPILLNKIDKFIDQTIEELNVILVRFHKEAMTQFKHHFKEPEKDLLELLLEYKKKVAKEFDSKEKHIQLVFSRYEEYPIDEKKERWNIEFNQMQNQLSEVKTRILNLMELKDNINKAIDSYYDMAQPAYGYKVPIQALSENMDISEDKLENLFVELISNNFVTGEIDPVTKVVVLAPRMTGEQVPTKQLKSIRCMVCNLTISPGQEEIIYCPHCNSPAHRSHLIEWVKIKGTCPTCKRNIKML